MKIINSPLLSEEELAEKTMYYSLEEALENAADCYMIELADDSESEQTLSEALKRLTKLQVFILQNNQQVSQLPKEIAGLKNLQYLEIRDSMVETFPSEMEQLDQVTDFIATGCPSLAEFPTCINNWKNLVYLDISDTQLEEVPAEIGGFSKLEDLNINQNLLETLPPEIGRLSSLKVLRTYGNYAMLLPLSIQSLRSLETFDHGLMMFDGKSNPEVQAAMPNATFNQITTHDEVKEDSVYW